MGIKKVKELHPSLRPTISNRPPATLPKDTHTSVEDNYDDYATIQLDSFSVSDRETYDYVHGNRNTFPKEINAGTLLTQSINLNITSCID